MGMVCFRKGKLMNGIMKFPFMSTVQGKRNTCIQYTRKKCKVTHLNLINHPTLKMSCDICHLHSHCLVLCTSHFSLLLSCYEATENICFVHAFCYLPGQKPQWSTVNTYMKKLAHLAHQEPVLDIPNFEHSIRHNYDSGSTVVVLLANIEILLVVDSETTQMSRKRHMEK